MKIFHYNPVTKELIASGDAEESQLETGVYHVPANATLDPLPEGFDPASQVALYRPEYWETGIAKEQGGAWHIMPLIEETEGKGE